MQVYSDGGVKKVRTFSFGCDNLDLPREEADKLIELGEELARKIREWYDNLK
jgi:hypothetical protein